MDNSSNVKPGGKNKKNTNAVLHYCAARNKNIHKTLQLRDDTLGRSFTARTIKLQFL